MYHPSRGGVRGGRDQFQWDDVKVDKHRENYLGHSIKAPVGRWQKGKDLFWYARDKKSKGSQQDDLKAEIQRVKEEEEQLMREALGLTPKRASRPQGNRIDKHEFTELVKRGSTAEDLGAGHAEAAQVHGLGYSRAPKNYGESSSLPPSMKDTLVEPRKEDVAEPSSGNVEEIKSEDERSQKKRRREERKREKHEKREKRHSHDSDYKRKHRDSDDKRKHRKEERRRHDSD